MAALPVEQAAVRAVSPVTGQMPSGWKEIEQLMMLRSRI